ncbi:MAG: galactokinase [Firmicutes bacterium]|nr:galactokinase [Bacillota bacterium]
MSIDRNEVEEIFARAFGDAREMKFEKAPGRVNLIGEHTDYNEGFVLPMAIDRDIAIGFRLRDDNVVRLYSADYGQYAEFSLDAIEYDDKCKWSNYFRGVAHVFQKHGLPQKYGVVLPGIDAVVHGDVPKGSGLSSSAAFEVATARVLIAASGIGPIDPVEIAKLCQEAENDFVGVRCGIMDQMASVLGRPGHAVFLDCRDYSYELVSLPFQGLALAICDTGVRRGLAQSEYNRRRQECETGVGMIREMIGQRDPRRKESIRALRDVSPLEFEEVKGALPPVIANRCWHVISENERVLANVQALKNGDIERFGVLMNESHESLRKFYEVSCEALDVMVELARQVNGVFGARMTGAGFGGCAISLMNAESVEPFIDHVIPQYREKMIAALENADSQPSFTVEEIQESQVFIVRFP